MNRVRTTLALGAVIAIQVAGSAFAEGTPLQEQLRACSRLQNSSERLSCYDRTTASIGDAAAPLPPTSPETVFGVGGQLTREAAPPKEVEREQLQSINAAVKAVRVTGGVLLIDLDNDQTWQQMDSTSLLLKVGETVSIARGAFNSFRLTTTSKRTSRVKRLQ